MVIHEGIKIKLLEIGVGTKFYNIIKSMYICSRSCIRVDKQVTGMFKICINNLQEYFVSISDDCVQLGDKSLRCLMYADDLVLLSKSSNGLQQKLNCLENFFNDWCFHVNTSNARY